MLDFIFKNNEWEPPELTSEDFVECYNKIQSNANQAYDMLFILKVKPYVDAVLLHIDMVDGDSFTFLNRYVFREGYVWSIEAEEMFVKRCLKNSRCACTYEKIDEIYKIYTEKHPDWHLKRYYTKPFRLLDHIYHCMREGSVKEMLYKAELDELAENITSIDEIDLLSSKPTDIYEGISIRTLRALNCKSGADLLSISYNRKFLVDLQKKFPDNFSDRLNDAQCMYLNHLITGDLTIGEVGRLFQTRKRFLFSVWNQNQYEMFLRRIKDKEEAVKTVKALSKIDPIYTKVLTVNMGEYESVDYRIEQLREYLLLKRKDYDAKVRRSNRKRDESWQERNHGYVIRYPQTINDFCREAIYMNHCLLTYLEAVVCNDTTILFIREAHNVNKPFITIEIYDDELMQAYHRHNEDCTLEEAEWIRKYCKRHGIGTGHFQFNNELDCLY